MKSHGELVKRLREKKTEELREPPYFNALLVTTNLIKIGRRHLRWKAGD